MEIKIITDKNQIDTIKWQNFVKNHPDGNFFQTPQLHHYLSNIQSFKPFIITIWESNNIIGILQGYQKTEGNGLKKYFSSRTIIYGGPLINCEDNNFIFNKLINTLNEDNNTIYTEFRNIFNIKTHKNLFKKAGYEYHAHLNYIINIPNDEEETLKLLNSSKRRQVRKSLKNGAKITTPRSKEDVRKFYEILKKLYTTKVKKPLPSLEFFEKFYEDKSLGQYLLIQYNDRIIGGIMCPIYNKTLYEWYIGGEDGMYNNIYPSVLATYAPLQFGAQQGYQYFDFLGAGKPDQDYGVREFKSKFGGKEVEFGRFVRINKPILYKIGKLGFNFSKKLNL